MTPTSSLPLTFIPHMASFGNLLSFFLLFLLLISPQIQAREPKFFSLFSHFRTIYNVKDPLHKTKVESPALAPGPVTFEPASALEPVSAPEPALEPVSAPAPSVEQAIGSTIPSGPAPEPEFSESGEGYGLYGRASYNQYSPTKETPTTTTTTNFELLNEDFNDESYKTGYPKTKFYSSSNNNNEEFRQNVNYNEEFRNNANNNEELRNNAHNNEEFRNNGNKYEEFRNNVNNNEEFSINDNNNEEYRSTYSGGYASNFNDRLSNNNYNDRGNYHNNNNNYEGKREGMSDTRFLEKGKYYYNVNTVNENYNLNGYESGRGSTAENEGYYEKSQYPNEFDTMEEYEKQQEEQGYTP